MDYKFEFITIPLLKLTFSPLETDGRKMKSTFGDRPILRGENARFRECKAIGVIEDIWESVLLRRMGKKLKPIHMMN